MISVLPKYITCPWCKSPMHLILAEYEDGHIRTGDEQLRDYYYDCGTCGAESPHAYCVGTEEYAEKRLAEMCNIG